VVEGLHRLRDCLKPKRGEVCPFLVGNVNIRNKEGLENVIFQFVSKHKDNDGRIFAKEIIKNEHKAKSS